VTGEAWQRRQAGTCGQAVVKGKWGRLGRGRTDWGNKRQRGDKERPHKTRDFEECASMPKTSLLLFL